LPSWIVLNKLCFPVTIVKQRVQEILSLNDKASLDNVINAVAQDLDAQKEVVYNSKGDTKFIQDNPARQKAQETLLKLHGALDTKTEVNQDNRQVNITIEQGDDKRLEDIAARIEDMTRKLELKDGGQTGEIIDVEAQDSEDPA
jgi:vacuolar-type H+-ATPase subunit E/Vma4